MVGHSHYHTQPGKEPVLASSAHAAQQVTGQSGYALLKTDRGQKGRYTAHELHGWRCGSVLDHFLIGPQSPLEVRVGVG